MNRTIVEGPGMFFPPSIRYGEEYVLHSKFDEVSLLNRTTLKGPGTGFVK